MLIAFMTRDYDENFHHDKPPCNFRKNFPKLFAMGFWSRAAGAEGKNLSIDASVALDDPLQPADVPWWNDCAYKQFLEACATELGLTINALYERAGVDPSNHAKTAIKNGRSIVQILKLAKACRKAPMLLIAAGTLGRNGADESADLDLARLAVVSTLTSHLYVALSPNQPSAGDISRLLKLALDVVKTDT
jgi:hypothetical protein